MNQSTVVQNNQESRRKYRAIRWSVCWFAHTTCTAHLFGCSALLASIARSAALIHSLARSLTPKPRPGLVQSKTFHPSMEIFHVEKFLKIFFLPFFLFTISLFLFSFFPFHNFSLSFRLSFLFYSFSKFLSFFHFSFSRFLN